MAVSLGRDPGRPTPPRSCDIPAHPVGQPTNALSPPKNQIFSPLPLSQAEKGEGGKLSDAGAASNRPHPAREAHAPARTERRDGEALAGWGSTSRRFPCGLGRWGRRRRVFDTISAERVCRGARAEPRWCRRWGAPGGGRDGRWRGKRRALDTAGSRGAGDDHGAVGGSVVHGSSPTVGGSRISKAVFARPMTITLDVI